MAISLACPCGKNLKVKDTLAGKKIYCPECKDVLRVPEPEVEVLLLEEEPQHAPKRTPSTRQDIREGEPPAPRKARRKVMEDEDYDDTPPPRRKKKKKQSAMINEGWFGSINGGVLGGVLMIFIAVVWFVLGMMADRIFFYPPILLIVGLVAIVKGLFAGR